MDKNWRKGITQKVGIIKAATESDTKNEDVEATKKQSNIPQNKSKGKIVKDGILLRRAQIYRMLYLLRNERSIQKFESMIKGFLKNIEDQKEFLEYFLTYYNSEERRRMWALCYRIQGIITTTSHIENFHRLLNISETCTTNFGKSVKTWTDFLMWRIRIETACQEATDQINGTLNGDTMTNDGTEKINFNTVPDACPMVSRSFECAPVATGASKKKPSFTDSTKCQAIRRPSFGKSMIQTFTALMLPNTMFVIMCPIIAFVDDQFKTVNNEYQIPAARYHGELPLHINSSRSIYPFLMAHRRVVHAKPCLEMLDRRALTTYPISQ